MDLKNPDRLVLSISKQLVKLIVLSCSMMSCYSQPTAQEKPYQKSILPGAERTVEYFPWLNGKRLAVVANQTSLVGEMNLVDTLVAAGFNLKRIFSPEHGFRGQVEAGEEMGNSIDSKTGIPIVSLYGKMKKPALSDLDSIDLVIFDVQDVGVRFYTYISTLSYVMEACAEKGLPLLILDRPNPNGFYVDGPVLEKEFASFVGLHPVPVVHGMTVAEYAQMVNGEHWLAGGKTCDLKLVKVEGYNHQTLYKLTVPPSPNLRTMNAIYLYPALGLFEGTQVSVGRGTDRPFEQIGYPDNPYGVVDFTPVSMAGMSLHPMYEGKVCSGYPMNGIGESGGNPQGALQLSWVIIMYSTFPNKDQFFTPFFDKLAGTAKLRQQITAKKPEYEIRDAWKPGLEQYKKIRAKYLLYPDFK